MTNFYYALHIFKISRESFFWEKILISYDWQDHDLLNFSESETEAWYYSTQPQFEELLEVLDKNNYERDLYQTLLEFKEDILKHMSITEELTNSHKGNRKSAIEIEIGLSLNCSKWCT